jgi:hypothetical protein
VILLSVLVLVLVRARAPRTGTSTRTRVLLAALLSGPALAADPSPGEIVRRAQAHLAFRDFAGELRVRMVLERPGGERRERAMACRVRQDGGLARSRIEFLSPPDVAGTRFLVIENAGREDDQFLYLPALKRVRRVAGSQKNQSFMGSDFSYADLEGRDVEGASYRRLGDETVAGAPAWVIEAAPRSGSGSPYGKVVMRVRKSDFLTLRADYHDAAGALLKTLNVVKTGTVDGRLLVTTSRMEDAKDGHVTTFVIEQAQSRTDLPAGLFTVDGIQN